MFFTQVLQLVNNHGVAGAVLQTPLLIINSVSDSSSVEISSAHIHSQTVKARKLKF